VSRYLAGGWLMKKIWGAGKLPILVHRYRGSYGLQLDRTVRSPDLATELPRLGALERWRAEIRSGKRRNDFKSFDGLAAAAGSELTARRLAAEGDWPGAAWFLDRARVRLEDFWGDPSSKTGWDILKRLQDESGTARVESTSDGMRPLPARRGVSRHIRPLPVGRLL
jgi:hypothetical protein